MNDNKDKTNKEMTLEEIREQKASIKRTLDELVEEANKYMDSLKKLEDKTKALPIEAFTSAVRKSKAGGKGPMKREVRDDDTTDEIEDSDDDYAIEYDITNEDSTKRVCKRLKMLEDDKSSERKTRGALPLVTVSSPKGPTPSPVKAKGPPAPLPFPRHMKKTCTRAHCVCDDSGLHCTVFPVTVKAPIKIPEYNPSDVPGPCPPTPKAYPIAVPVIHRVPFNKESHDKFDPKEDMLIFISDKSGGRYYIVNKSDHKAWQYNRDTADSYSYKGNFIGFYDEDKHVITTTINKMDVTDIVKMRCTPEAMKPDHPCGVVPSGLVEHFHTKSLPKDCPYQPPPRPRTLKEIEEEDHAVLDGLIVSSGKKPLMYGSKKGHEGPVTQVKLEPPAPLNLDTKRPVFVKAEIVMGDVVPPGLRPRHGCVKPTPDDEIKKRIECLLRYNTVTRGDQIRDWKDYLGCHFYIIIGNHQVYEFNTMSLYDVDVNPRGKRLGWWDDRVNSIVPKAPDYLKAVPVDDLERFSWTKIEQRSITFRQFRATYHWRCGHCLIDIDADGLHESCKKHYKDEVAWEENMILGDAKF